MCFLVRLLGFLGHVFTLFPLKSLAEDKVHKSSDVSNCVLREFDFSFRGSLLSVLRVFIRLFVLF